MTKNKATRVCNLLKSSGYRVIISTYNSVKSHWPAKNGFIVKPLNENGDWFVELSGFLNNVIPYSVWRGEKNEDIGSHNFYGWELNNGHIENSYQIAERAKTFMNSLEERKWA